MTSDECGRSSKLQLNFRLTSLPSLETALIVCLSCKDPLELRYFTLLKRGKIPFLKGNSTLNTS